MACHRDTSQTESAPNSKPIQKASKSWLVSMRLVLMNNITYQKNRKQYAFNNIVRCIMDFHFVKYVNL